MSSKCIGMPHACHVHTVHVHARCAQYMYCQCTQCHNITILHPQWPWVKNKMCLWCFVAEMWSVHTVCTKANLACTVCTWRACDICVHVEDILRDLYEKIDPESDVWLCIYGPCTLWEKKYQPSTFEKHNMHEKNSCVQSMHATCIIKVCACR